MVESHWAELRGTELRYRDDTWELTGDVDVREQGELLALEARQVDDVRRTSARLYFGLENPTHSLNPGDPGEHVDRLERSGTDQYLVVKKKPRAYRYVLQRLAFE